MTKICTPDGLPGFDETRQWELERDDDAVFGVLRNVEQPSIGLLVAEPWELAPGYEPDLPDDELRRIGIDGPKDVQLLVVATIAGDPRPEPAPTDGDRRTLIWLNLAAPIAVNTRTWTARQVILDRQGWPMRHEITAGC